MPGLVGYISRGSLLECHDTLANMRDAISHEMSCTGDALFHVDNLRATRVHLNILQKQTQPVLHAGMYVWMDGEIYNGRELSKKHGLKSSNDLELLARLIERDSSFRTLGEIDGFFSAVIFDPQKNKLFLVTDRYGLRHLYWTHHGDGVAWSSEVKAFLELPRFSSTVDRIALEQFLDIGYLLNDRTWFEDVKLMDSGSVLECDLRDGSTKQHRYWWWNEIHQREETEITDDLIDEMGDLFVRAVRTRCRIDERVGLTLSGGLDSRAILASMPASADPLEAVTFGRAESIEVQIAAMAAQVRGARHQIESINEGNWLDDRIAGVWWSDGQFDIQHMHGIESRTTIRNVADINMNGYAGDLIVGGSYLNGAFRDRSRSRREATAEFMGCDPARLEGFEACEAHPSSDIYFLQNRVRRFTHHGIKLGGIHYETRKPFYDNALIEFAYGLPDHLRRDGTLYQRMLLRRFPDYFRNIPYYAYGVPIGSSKFRRRISRWRRKIKASLNRRMRHLGRHIGKPDQTTDYETWFHQEPARLILSDVLRNPQALLGEFVHSGRLDDALERHRAGENHTRMLSRFFTVELWLQQVFNRRHRQGFEHTRIQGQLQDAA